MRPPDPSWLPNSDYVRDHGVPVQLREYACQAAASAEYRRLLIYVLISVVYQHVAHWKSENIGAAMKWPYVHATASPWATSRGKAAYDVYIEPRAARLHSERSIHSGFPRKSTRSDVDTATSLYRNNECFLTRIDSILT